MRRDRAVAGGVARGAVVWALAAAVAAVCSAACSAPAGGPGDRSAAPPPAAEPGTEGVSKPADGAGVPGGLPGQGALGEPCPAAPALEDLHTALWQLERTDERAEPVERAARARGEIEEGGMGAGWGDLAAAIERAASTDVPFAEIEELRARLHESPCLDPELHRRLHRRLDDPLRWDPVDGSSP